MTSSKGNIMGSKPAEDPMEMIETRGFQVTYDKEVRWDDRSLRPPWERVLGLILTILILTFLAPVPILLISVTVLVFLISYPRIYLWLQARSMKSIELDEVPESDVLVEKVDERLQCRGTGPIQYLTALHLDTPGPILSGDLGRLIRGVDTDFGFLISVVLERENPKEVVEEGILADHIVKLLSIQSSEQRGAYFNIRSGIWKSGVRILGSSYDFERLGLFCSQVKGAIPISGLDEMDADLLARTCSDWSCTGGVASFRGTGRELCDWLVQLPSELASEVGANVPGEFISPIRSSDFDYSLGHAVNPETLKAGPEVGITHEDLNSGLLVCGGDWSRRADVLAGLIKEILERGKRVLVISEREEALRLAGIDESGIALRLGKQLILNPVDPEAIPRSRFVSELLLLLETLAGTDLSSAADFEVALNRVVALGNGTLADISLSEDPLAENDTSSTPNRVSRVSLLAMDAVKRLHEGSGAQAFYGNQTIQTQRLSDHKLTVISTSMGAVDLDIFAMQLLCLKLSGIKADKNLVIILDSPENLRVAASSYRYKKQGILAYRTVLSLLRRGPLIVSMKNPSSMPSDTADIFGSCIALRMRDTQDLAAVSDLLSLTVVGGGMHSKKRVSSREGSFLRVMDPGYALASTSEYKTCMPLKLNPAPEMEPVSPEQASDLLAPSTNPEIGRSRTLLDTIGGKDARTVVRVLRLLTKYEPLTEQSVRQFLKARGDPNADVEAILARLEKASMILRGHENHSGVSYTNYRITMKGTMALRQSEEVAGE